MKFFPDVRKLNKDFITADFEITSRPEISGSFGFGVRCVTENLKNIKPTDCCQRTDDNQKAFKAQNKTRNQTIPN